MAKFYTIFALLLLVVLVALASAEPPRYRTSRRNGQLRTNVRFLQRQEVEGEEAEVAAVEPVAAPTEAPAPYPAAGITPEVPFDLLNETEATVPETSYGPPAAGENDATTDLTPIDAEELPIEGGDVESQSIIQPRHKSLRARAPRPIPLVLRSTDYEIIRSEPIIVYTLK